MEITDVKLLFHKQTVQKFDLNKKCSTLLLLKFDVITPHCYIDLLLPYINIFQSQSGGLVELWTPPGCFQLSVTI